MALRIGIVGLPQSGKTSLFKAITGSIASISGYATSSVQANFAVVSVPDERVPQLAAIFKPKKVTYATVEFVDVAGMGQKRGEERSKGLSAEFLGHVRNADALALVLRSFSNERVPHPLGSIDPLRDLERLEEELVLTDLATVERRIERTAKAAKSGEKKYQQELEMLARLQEALSDGTPLHRLELGALEQALLKELFLLTMKPRMYVLNVSEEVLGAAGELLERLRQDAAPAEPPEGELRAVAAVARRAREEGAETVAVSARLEAELRELPPEEIAEYMASLGIPWLGAERVIQVGYRLLNLITFLTVGEDEVRAWTVTRGAKAPEAAGKIHSDMERGFIRAEITHFTDFMACGGSFAAAARRGLQRLEGKDYVMQDGDIAHFRFNVSR